MKKLLINLLVVASTQINAQTWKVQTSNTNKEIASVHFVNAYIGYAVGVQGTALKTIDAGRTWTPLTTGYSVDYMGVKFVNDTCGWIVGLSGTILYTSNGGKTFTKQVSGSTKKLYEITAINASTAWIAGEQDAFLTTSDTGKTWTAKPTGQSWNGRGVFFLNKDTGFIACENGRICKTIDGGTNWTISTTVSSQVLYSVQFINDEIGYCSGGIINNPVIYKTINGGSTWTSVTNVPQNVNIIYDINFVDTLTGYAACHAGYYIKTTDGGKTWESENLNTTSNLKSIQFVNPYKAWITGSSGTILNYTRKQEICMVTTDTSVNKYMIIWERIGGMNTKYYNIYKLNGSSYSVIGTVNFNELSGYHQPMRLFVNQGSPITTFNLQWDKYEDETGKFAPAKYYVYRSADKLNWGTTPYDSVSGALPGTKTDFNVTQIYYYIISIEKLDACRPASLLKIKEGPYLSSISNLEDNRLKSDSGIHLIYNQISIHAAPVPFSDYIDIEISRNTSWEMSISMYNVMGEKILIYEIESLDSHNNSYRINTAHLANGVYFIRVNNDEASGFIKVVKQY